MRHLVAWSLAALLAHTAAKAVGPLPYYTVGDAIPVSCLNRTVETGEHITNDKGELQYVPFPTCNETGRPLELYFGIEKGVCSVAAALIRQTSKVKEKHHKLTYT